MAGEIDHVTLINRALARIGAPPIFARDEETELAATVDAVYDTELGLLFGKFDWNFARRTVRLTRSTLTFENGWTFAYEMPGDRIDGPSRVIERPAQPDQPLRYFAIEEGFLFANAETVYATFRFPVEPRIWPPVFQACFVAALAGALALPVAQDRVLAEHYTAMAYGSPAEQGRGGLFAQAAAADLRQHQVHAPLYASDPLNDARLHPAGPWYGA